MIWPCQNTVAVDLALDEKAFSEKLKQYMRYSSKTLAEALNHRAVNISFKAIRHTPAAKKGKVKSDMLKTSSVAPGVPLGAIMVQKYLGNKKPRYATTYQKLDGKHGAKPFSPRDPSFSENMRQAVEDLIDYRNWSRGYIKAGWFGVIRALRSVQRIKRKGPKSVKAGPKALRQGKAKPARDGFSPRAIIENYVPGAAKIGANALGKAMQDDIRDMSNYLIAKLKGKADAGDRAYKRLATQKATSRFLQTYLGHTKTFR